MKEISYTEKEYDYAVSMGIPVFIFIISDNAKKESYGTETSKRIGRVERYTAFENFIRETAFKHGCKRWASPKEIIKLFGSGFTTEDYLYLQDQYDDWCARTQVDSKSQQTYIVRICFKLLDIYKAQKAGKETSKLDDSLNNLLGAANLQPRQNVGNASTDSLTFGQLIERWEQEDPILIPEEYVDVDNLSKYVDVWFKGGLSRALNLDNGYSKEYDEYIDQYTVKPPEYMGDDGESDENIYTKIFGAEDK